MTQTTFSEFRNHAKKYFDAVEKKKVTIQIYRHGKPIAVLAPVSQKQSRWKQRQPLTIPGLSLSQAILEEREEGR